MEQLSALELRRAVQQALIEDVGGGDVTTLAAVPAETMGRAVMAAREPLTLAGLAFAEAVFRQLSPKVQFRRVLEDGQSAGSGDLLLEISGPARALLTGERVALNFVQRLSGIATLTAQYVAAIRQTRAQILDTRKT